MLKIILIFEISMSTNAKKINQDTNHHYNEMLTSSTFRQNFNDSELHFTQY